jgi:hypothetical protein
MTKQVIFNQPIILKNPSEDNKYQPIGKNDNIETNAIRIGFLLIETTTPNRKKTTINTPGVVIIFNTFPVEYGFLNHNTIHKENDRNQKKELT